MFFVLSKILGFFALPSNVMIAIGLVGLVLLLYAIYAARELAHHYEPRADCTVWPVAARQCADTAAGAAFSTLGRYARTAGRHCHPRRLDLAGRVGRPRRSRARRSGGAHHGRRRIGAPLSERPHPVLGRQQCSDIRRGCRGYVCRTAAGSFGCRAATASLPRSSRATPSRTRCSRGGLPTRSRASAGFW